MIKQATNRRRPLQGGDGHFWNGGKSFPSGHAAHTWTLATVLASEYPDKPIVRHGAYAWATRVSLSRISGRRHFPSLQTCWWGAHSATSLGATLSGITLRFTAVTERKSRYTKTSEVMLA